MTECVVKHVMPAFVTYQELIVRRQQYGPRTVSPRAAAAMHIIDISRIPFFDQLATYGPDSIPALTNAEICLPYEITECCRRVAAEIFIRQQSHRLLT